MNTLWLLALLGMSGCGADRADVRAATASIGNTAPSASTAAAQTPAGTTMPMSPEPSAAPNTPQRSFEATPLAPDTKPLPSGATIAQPFDTSIAALVDAARADLARRLAVAADGIEVVEARSVVWPDRSLGCLRPGMEYPQVQVDGIVIRLRSAGRIFDYHAGGERGPFLCEAS